jgi:thiamine-phosphate pyrophosphorylase
VKPVLCLITDRRRLGPDDDDRLVRRVAAASRAGVHLVQVRERELDGGPLARLVAGCVEAVGGTRTRVLVNDRIDVALAAGAHGVHLRGDSMPASRARRITPAGFLIGKSVHTVAEVADVMADGGADYLVFGTVFPTASKPGQAPAGIAALAAIVAATSLPVLAVGGVTTETARRVAQAGAAGLAAIGLFAAGDDEFLQVAVSEVNMAFDTPAGVP